MDIDLGGWGIVVWAVGGALVLLFISRLLMRRVRRMVGLAVLAVALSAYGIGFPVGLSSADVIGNGSDQTCSQHSESSSLSDLPARAMCGIKNTVSGLADHLPGRE